MIGNTTLSLRQCNQRRAQQIDGKPAEIGTSQLLHTPNGFAKYTLEHPACSTLLPVCCINLLNPQST